MEQKDLPAILGDEDEDIPVLGAHLELVADDALQALSAIEAWHRLLVEIEIEVTRETKNRILHTAQW